ncbi:MAG: DEAD/DEAH box helicase [Candidatus Eisenbacteria bacterium]|nr:DEAD/DEAH box helicase [Candidatus Eisenbacteria bacterium]MCC7141225.1 DEAD/DEAH box helicase [Candidatus Eisenbacteria bacterium]
MAVSHRKFEVGERIYHQDYGVGMVVEVRPRPFFDVLEVAFEDGVRRLNSNHPKVGEVPARVPETPSRPNPHTETKPSRPKRGSTAVPRPRRAERNGTTEAKVAITDLDGPAKSESADAIQELAPESEPAAETPPRFAFTDAEALSLDQGSVEELLRLTTPTGDLGAGFLFHVQAARLSLTHGFRDLLALSAVRDMDRHDFQVNAVLRVLRQMRGRAILADEVGLGKTIEAGLILKEYVLRGLVRRALVLTPVSLMSQWREELRHKFDLPFEIRTRGERWADHPFLIASIDTAKTERHREEIGAAEFDLLIVDEAHRVRNHLTQGWKFVDALSLKYLLLLTATPVQNDLRELYNLVTLLKPGALGTYRAFRKEFMVRGDKRLPKNTRTLARMLSRVMVRTSRSSTALPFPNREVKILPFEMTKEERALYDGVAEFVRDAVELAAEKDAPRWNFLLMVLQKEMGSSAVAATRTLERCRPMFEGGKQARALRKLIDIGRAVKRQSKAEGLVELIKEQDGDKVIVFTQFRRTLEFLEQRLSEEGIRAALFHGSLDPKRKDQAIEAFRGKIPVLLSTEAGGEGRNLQFCRNVVNYDLPWNPMRIEQRIGRVHRLGQTRDTRIWNFSTRDTVEDHVLSILHRKIQMFELVIGEMDMVLGHWSDRESFENEVFRIWTRVRNPEERRLAFEEFGDQLALARQRHERVKDFDESIFSRLEISPALAGEEGEG